MRESHWTIVDNSGIKTAKQIYIQKYKRQRALPGDIMKVVPQKFKLIKRVVKKEKYWGLVLNVKSKVRRIGGISIQGYSNSLVIMDKRYRFQGSKIFGPAMREMQRRRGSYAYKKILARIGYFI